MANTTADKLRGVLRTKENIRRALIQKGVDVSERELFSSYPGKVLQIISEGIDTISNEVVSVSLNKSVQPWTRPNLTSYTSYGNLTTFNPRGTEDSIYALDGNYNTNYVPYGYADSGFIWELPVKLKFIAGTSVITWVHRNNSETMSNETLQFFADKEGTIPLTDTFTDGSSSNQRTELPVITDCETDVIYFFSSIHSGAGGAAEIEFTNVYELTGDEVTGLTIVKGSFDYTNKKISFEEPISKTTNELISQDCGFKNKVAIYQQDGVEGFKLVDESFSDTSGYDVIKRVDPIDVYVNKTKTGILGLEPTKGLETSLKPVENFNINGNLTITDGIVSGFSTSSYIDFNNAGLVDVGSNTWEIKTKFKPMYSGSTEEEIIRAGKGIMIRTRSGGWKFILQNQSSSLFVNTTGGSFTTGNWYWLKASYDGTTYRLEVSTDGVQYNTIIQQVSSNTAYSTSLFNYIGFDGGTLTILNRGEVDLNETSMKIGDEVFWTPFAGVVFNTDAGYDYIDENLGSYELESALEQSLDDLVPEVSDRAKNMYLYRVLTQQGDTEIRLLKETPSDVSAYKKLYNVVLSDDLTTVESVEKLND